MEHGIDRLSGIVSAHNRPILEEEKQSKLRRMTQIAPEVINHNVFTMASSANIKFMQEQQEDASLIKYWEKARAGKGGFVIRDNILYKTKFPRIRSFKEYLLVLPQKHITKVLQTAHDSVEMGCHMGYKRTMNKILPVFFLPRAEIKQYVASCEECQRLAPKLKRERAQSILVPPINERFGHTWIIDAMRPTLQRVSRRNGNFQHVLVCIEQSTRWIELIPLTSLKAQTVSDALLTNIIARFHCEKFVYDQAYAHMSEMMQGVLKLLRVHSNVSFAGYHARTAMCERYMRTIEKTLKAYMEDKNISWHRILPWLAFQWRQLPSETLDFSPHELA